MFSVHPLHPQQNAILEILGRKGELTMAELHSALNEKRGTRVSLQHVYRIVTQMTDHQMLVKSGKSVSLNLMWLAYLHFFANRSMAGALKRHQDLNIFPLKPGERRTVRADSFIALDTLWTHILVQLDSMLNPATWHTYNAHAWWQLLKMNADTSFYSNLQAKNAVCYGLYGNDTPLDRLGIGIIQSASFPSVIDGEPPFPKEGFILVVCGEYVVQSVLPDGLSRQLAFFFANTKSPGEFDEKIFMDIIRMPAACPIVIRRDAAEAEALRKKIARFFREKTV